VAAVKRHFQGASWQRCQVHFSRGLLGLVSQSKRAEPGAGLRLVFTAPTLRDARLQAEALAEASRPTHPQVAAQIEEHIEESPRGYPACFAFPPSHRVKVRSTNSMERLMEELRRRTRVIRIFPNREACLRLATALCAEQSDEWVSGKRYLDIGELRQWRCEHREQREEVTLTAI